MSLEEIAAELCTSCTAPLRPGAGFCVRCGAARVVSTSTASFSDVSFVLRFYVAMLVVHGAIAVMVALDLDAFTVDTAGSTLWAVVTVLAALMRREVLDGLYRTIGFPPRTLLLIVGASLPIYVLVDAYVDLLQGWLTFIKDPDWFASVSLIWPVIFVCAFPAVFEEMGFRGVIFGLLGRSLRLWEAVLISSFAFAILHMSFFALVTHLPLGLYFCLLRHRSASLIPPMIAHFLHNFWSVLDSRWDWFAFV